MAKEKVKLQELKAGQDIVLINGLKYLFTGFEKRKTNLGKQEMFIFKINEEKIPEGASREQKYERWNFNKVQITKLDENSYEWS